METSQERLADLLAARGQFESPRALKKYVQGIVDECITADVLDLLLAKVEETPDMVVADLLQESGIETVLRRIATRSEILQDRQALRHAGRSAQMGLADNPHLTEAEAVELATLADEKVITRLAMNPKGHPAALEVIFETWPDNGAILQAVGDNPSTPKFLVERLTFLLGSKGWVLTQRSDCADLSLGSSVQYLLERRGEFLMGAFVGRGVDPQEGWDLAEGWRGTLNDLLEAFALVQR